MNNSTITFASTSIKALSSADGAKRADQLKVQFKKLVVIDGWNVRKTIDMDHVQDMVTAFENGQEPSDFVVAPILVDGETQFGIIGGHHTHASVQIIIDKGGRFTPESEFTVKVSKAQSAADRIVAGYNANQGLNLTYLDKARNFQALKAEGKSNAQIAALLGERPSVISNALYLLKGDDELLSMVENDVISGTRAMLLLREHGAENATKYAKAEANIFEELTPDSAAQEATETSTVPVTIDSENGTTSATVSQENQLSIDGAFNDSEHGVNASNDSQIDADVTAAKTHKKPAKRQRLTPKQLDKMESLFLIMAGNMDKLELTEAVAAEVTKLQQAINEIRQEPVSNN